MHHTTSSKAQEIAMTSTLDAALAHWDIEREIVLSRVIKAKRDVVFAAWTEPEHLHRFGSGRRGSRSKPRKSTFASAACGASTCSPQTASDLRIECAFSGSSRRTSSRIIK